MPITIKELFPSDPISEALEKINFNFDQLILAGGGPPGPTGPQGPQGVAGPNGKRGDHWFVGPSAFGQTADHDGGDLLVQDHFLDSNGDVFSYFEISGITGWTASGINLKGPTGPKGETGGSLDWGTYDGGDGNSVTPIGEGWGPQFTTSGTTSVDFFIPSNMAKNSIFIGDLEWANTQLQYFGSLNGITDTNSVPQISIIQKNVNSGGLNGLMIGAYGAETGSTSIGTAEGSTASLTDSYNFAHLSLVKSLNPNGPFYERSLRLKTFKQKFRIELGGNGSYESLIPMDISSKEFNWINNSNGQYFYSGTKQGIITKYENSLLGSTHSYISLFSKPFLGSNGVSDVNNIFGYISLQSEQGTPPSTPTTWNPHGYGGVLIGPTSTTGVSNYPIGIRMQQGLGISRPIDENDNYHGNDASIRFFHNSLLEAANEFSSTLGGIRAFKNSVVNSNGTVPSASIQISSGYPSSSDLTGSKIVSGRLGLNNHSGFSTDGSTRKINFPVHVNLTSYGDLTKADRPYEGQNVIDLIDTWALGIDYDNVSGETAYSSGIDSSSSGLGVAYSHSHTGATGSSATRSIILQSYYNMIGSTNSITGRRTPHMYTQIGVESGPSSYGNLGIGFVPKSGIGQPLGTEAWSKLSVDGSVTIGSVSTGYHTISVNRPSSGILVEGSIFQGATSLQNQLRNYNYSGASLALHSDSLIRISSVGAALSDKFISRRNLSATNYDKIPDFSLPDLRTGISFLTGQTGKAHLVVSTNSTNGTSPAGPVGDPIGVAFWGNRGDLYDDYSPAFVSTKRFAQSTDTSKTNSPYGKTISLQELSTRAKAVSYRYNSGTGYRNVRKVWFPIPTDHSTVVLDLSKGISGMGYWNSSGDWVDAAFIGGLSPNNKLFLNGTTWNDSLSGLPTSPAAQPLRGQFGFTLDNGKYEGQQLTLVIKNVASWNLINGNITNPSFIGATATSTLGLLDYYVRIKPENPYESIWQSATTPGVPPTLVDNLNRVDRDRIVMARDFISPQTLDNNLLYTWKGGNLDSVYTPGSSTNNTWSGMPWPTPHSMLSSGVSLALNRSGVVGSTTTNQNSTGSLFASLYQQDSTIHSAGWSGELENRKEGYQYTGGTFILFPWRVIKFVWVNDWETTSIHNRGSWIEVSREYLASPGQKYVGPVITIDPEGFDE